MQLDSRVGPVAGKGKDTLDRTLEEGRLLEADGDYREREERKRRREERKR